MTQDNTSSDALKEGEDFYLNDHGLVVLTESYHLKRGFCCKSGCFHCPYGFTAGSNPEIPAELNNAWGACDDELEIYDGEIDED